MDDDELWMDSDELRMSAYYYTFRPTGVRSIDLILSAVATAGKLAHHTGHWTDVCCEMKPFSGRTPIEWIQNAADSAAQAVVAQETERQPIEMPLPEPPK